MDALARSGGTASGRRGELLAISGALALLALAPMLLWSGGTLDLIEAVGIVVGIDVAVLIVYRLYRGS